MTAALILILRVLLVLFLVRLALRLLAGFLRRGRRTGAPDSGVEMVRDRMCNTFLPRHRALRAVIAGREEHFCSEACRDRAAALSPAS